MTGNTHFWLRLVLVVLGLAVGTSAFVLSGTIASKIRKKLFGEQLESIEPKRHTRHANTKRILAGFLAVGFILGWFGRDLWAFNNMYISSDLFVTSHPQTNVYWFLDAQHNHFPKKFCGYIPDFDIDSKIDYILYEDKGSCWDVSHHKFTFKVVRNLGSGKPVNFSKEINLLLGELR